MKMISVTAAFVAAVCISSLLALSFVQEIRERCKARFQQQLDDRDLIKGHYYHFIDVKGKELHFVDITERTNIRQVYEMRNAEGKSLGSVTITR